MQKMASGISKFTPPHYLCTGSNQRQLGQLAAPSSLRPVTSIAAVTTTSLRAVTPSLHADGQTAELDDTTWDNLGLDKPMSTDYMFVMKTSKDGNFVDGGLQRFDKIEFNPAACVLNYGQGIIEELKAYKKPDDSIVLFRPEEHGLRMRIGADRLCMPAPTVEQFVEAVKMTVLANRRWVPPPNKGFLHIQPLLIGNGPVLSLTPAPEFLFLVYVTPMDNPFKGSLEPINLVVENEIHRAVRGGAGSVEAIGNYAAILKTMVEAQTNGFSDVLFLDAVHKRYLEKTSTANIFLVKDKIISTPALEEGTILPGITRQCVIEIARSQGYQVEERLVSVEELLEADEVFCTGNAVCISSVSSITCLGKRMSYLETGLGVVSQQLYKALSNIQIGLAEDKVGWTVNLKQEGLIKIIDPDSQTKLSVPKLTDKFVERIDAVVGRKMSPKCTSLSSLDHDSNSQNSSNVYAAI